MLYMIENFLSDWTGLSRSQVSTLMILQDMPVMNYHIVRKIMLFPPSKMRERVLDPLEAQGWIRFYRIPHEEPGRIGPRKLAWALNEARKAEWDELVANAKVAARHKLSDATIDSKNLKVTLFGST